MIFDITDSLGNSPLSKALITISVSYRSLPLPQSLLRQEEPLVATDQVSPRLALGLLFTKFTNTEHSSLPPARFSSEPHGMLPAKHIMIVPTLDVRTILNSLQSNWHIKPISRIGHFAYQASTAFHYLRFCAHKGRMLWIDSTDVPMKHLTSAEFRRKAVSNHEIRCSRPKLRRLISWFQDKVLIRIKW